MGEYFNNLTGLQKVFAVCAATGFLLFALRLILQFFGSGDADAGDFDADADVEVSDFDADTDVSGSDVSFRLLSFQGLTGFFMMFGLVGLALSKESGVGNLLSMGGGLLAGLATVWVISKLFAYARQLQSSGTISMDSALMEEGTVYLTIPPKGTGKVQLTVQGRFRVCDAISEGDEPIGTGERVRVVRIGSGHVLVVEKA